MMINGIMAWHEAMHNESIMKTDLATIKLFISDGVSVC